jgi:peroxiredoxin
MSKRTSSTLQTGQAALLFSLRAANREGEYSLSSLLARGPVIVEFHRGTW